MSTAGGLAKAVERGEERGCESIQIFNQSPRMWRPTKYGEEDFAAFREAMDASKVEAVIIHAVYLINCASTDKELRKKSRDSLTHALRIGDAIGAAGVVLHPGSQKDEPLGALDQARRRKRSPVPSRTPTPAGSCSSRPPATKACWPATSTRSPT